MFGLPQEPCPHILHPRCPRDTSRTGPDRPIRSRRVEIRHLAIARSLALQDDHGPARCHPQRSRLARFPRTLGRVTGQRERVVDEWGYSRGRSGLCGRARVCACVQVSRGFVQAFLVRASLTGWGRYRQVKDYLPVIVPKLFPTLVTVASSMLNTPPSSAQEIPSMLHLILKTYKTSIIVNLSEHQQSPESLVPWGRLLFQVVNLSLPSDAVPENEEEREKSEWWKAKKWAYATLGRLFHRSGIVKRDEFCGLTYEKGSGTPRNSRLRCKRTTRRLPITLSRRLRQRSSRSIFIRSSFTCPSRRGCQGNASIRFSSSSLHGMFRDVGRLFSTDAPRVSSQNLPGFC